MRNDGLDELQAGIKVGSIDQQSQIWRRYSLMAESEEKLKNLFTRVKEASEIAGLKLYIKIN